MNMSKLQLVSRIEDKLNLTKNQVILLIKYNSAKEIEEIYFHLLATPSYLLTEINGEEVK